MVEDKSGCPPATQTRRRISAARMHDPAFPSITKAAINSTDTMYQATRRKMKSDARLVHIKRYQHWHTATRHKLVFKHQVEAFETIIVLFTQLPVILSLLCQANLEHLCLYSTRYQ